MAKKVTGIIKLQIPAGQANPAPPVGPALGQHGVNIMAFCKDFNAKTKDQPGMVIPVVITVYQDKSFTFITKSPPASALLKKAAATPPPSAAAAPKPVPAPAQPKPEPAAAPREIKLSTYLSGRSNLRAARENAAKELQRLQQVILAKAAGEPFYAEVEAKSQKLFDYLTPIDDAVVNKLDEAGKCPDPELQMELNKKVRELIQKQLNAIRTHPLAAFVEKNPFGKFAVKQPLEVTLAALDKQLS